MAQTESEKLVRVDKPRARLVLFETQTPLFDGGFTVRRYSTAHGVVYECWIYPNGRELWYKVKP